MHIIDHIYDAMLDDAALEALPDHMAELVGARSATFQIFAGQTPVHVASTYFTPEMTDYFQNENITDHDVWLREVTSRRLFNCTTDADNYLSREDFKQTFFFNEFFRRFGDDTGHCVGVTLRTRDGMVSLGLQSALTAPAIDPAVIATLDSVRPHLCRMVEGRGLLAMAKDAAWDLRAMLDAQAAAALLVDKAGVIHFANRAGERLLAAGDGLRSCRGVLRAVRAADAGPLEAALAQVGGAAAHGTSLLIGRGGELGSYRLVLTPQRTATRGRIVVLIEDPTMEDPRLSDRFREMFRFSNAEADLAIRLLNGQSLIEASQQRGVLEATSRTQLSNMLAKVGVKRQGELLTLLARVPRLDPSVSE